MDCLPPGTVFRIELDMLITEDDVYRLCKMRSDMPEYSKLESRTFLKAVPDPTSTLFFYVLPDQSRSKSRNNLELDSKNIRRISTASIGNMKTSGSSSLRFDSTANTLKPQSPTPKPRTNNIGWSPRKVDNITSNIKLSSQIRSTILKANEAVAKKRVSVDRPAIKGLATSLDPYKVRPGVNLYQTKSKMRELSS